MKIKIAVPSKGRISEPSINILEKAGLGLKDRESRKLISKTFNKDIDVLFARASDIPEFVQDGIADIGITGIDLIKESEADVIELLDLKFGKTNLVLAAPEDSNIKSIDDITSEMTLATEFPTLTKKYLEKNNLNLKIVKLSGSTEAAPFIGVADLITDLTSTGTTLKMNHLEIVDTLLKSSIVLIANKKSVETKKDFHVQSEVGEKIWTLQFVLPFELIHKYFDTHTDTMYANIYKCGNKKHYASYYPVKTEKPDYHRPEFFGKFVLEK